MTPITEAAAAVVTIVAQRLYWGFIVSGTGPNTLCDLILTPTINNSY